MVRDPAAFLMDEPLSNLDAKLRVQMRAEITRLQRASAPPRLRHPRPGGGDDDGGPDRGAERRAVQQLGPPLELYARQANTFVARFVGSPPMNILAGTVSDGIFRCEVGTLAVPHGTPDGATNGRLPGPRRPR